MQRFFITGTAHLDNPDLFQALESALDDVRADQLILEIPDDAVRRGDRAHQKPEIVCAYRWAERRGTACAAMSQADRQSFAGMFLRNAPVSYWQQWSA